MSDDEQQSQEGQLLMGDIEDQMEKVKDAGGKAEWPEPEDDEDDEEGESDYDKEKRLKQEIKDLKDKIEDYRRVFYGCCRKTTIVVYLQHSEQRLTRRRCSGIRISEGQGAG